MPYNPFYIESFKTGLEKDLSAFQLPEDAFTVLQDAFIWRGRVARKKGYESLGRLLRIIPVQALGNTTGSPHTGNIKTLIGLEPNAEIAQNSLTITVAAPNSEIFTEPAVADGTLVGDGGGTGTINYFTGVFTITSGAGWGAGQAVTAPFNYYPALPVMGIALRELTAINAEQTMAFDQVYVYSWSGAAGQFQESSSAVSWKGSDSDFFSSLNYRSGTAGGNCFFVTNFNTGGTPDPIRYFIGGWNNFLPPIDGAGNELHQARLLFNYKGRMIALNTWEGATLATSTNHPNRVRFSQNGDALGVNAWRSDIAGKGGYLGAPTSETIVSAEFVRDTLVVGFEKSMWKLRYTGNEILPFVWEQVDNEFGIESTFSIVRMDKAQAGVSENGITACDAINALRIDEKIPDEVFRIHNENDGIYRVHGIRDYDKKLIYWCYPSASDNRTFPNEVFVYNYETLSWSIFRDSFTCFGVLQEFNDRRWMDYPDTTWEEALFRWNEVENQALYPDVIAGNQNGYTMKIQQQSINDPAFAITVITPGTPVELTIVNHNLETDDYVRISGIIGTSDVLNGNSYKVNFVDEDNITLSDENGVPTVVAAGSTYLGGGEVAQLHDYRVRSKKFNLLEAGKSTEMGYLDFVINKTEFGEFNVDIYADNNNTEPMNMDDVFFNNTVSTQENDSDLPDQDKLIHRFFCRMHLQFMQFELNLTGAQKINQAIHDSDIELYALTLWVDKSGRVV